jgi:dTDP-4-dehydrorhamnose reductase
VENSLDTNKKSFSSRKGLFLITGSNGLLGQKIIHRWAENPDFDLIATARGENRLVEVSDFQYDSMDITNREEVLETLAKYKPDVLIHTAAMTNVDQCEEEREACWQLNVEPVRYLVEACEKNNVFLLHLSTDFIFDGTKGPLKEDEKPNPISFYGESKLAAEELVIQSKCSWAIARTVLVYGITEGMSRTNIVLWVKNSLENSKPIQLVNDQWRTPTLAEDLAIGCLLIAEKRAEGIYNISGEDFLNPYQMAIETADYFGLDKSLITETDGSKFTQKAKRPPKTGFVIDKAKKVLGYKPRSFKEGIALLATQLKKYGS